MKNTDENKKKFHFGIGSIVTVAVFSLCILLMVVNLIANKNNKLVYFFGYAYSVVPTESMDPTIKVDDVVLIKNKKYEEIHVDPEDGDIIVYYNPTLKIFVIHRAIGYFGDGSIMAKGDNNANPDTLHITEDIYRGTAYKWGECLGLGRLVNSGRNIIFVVIIFVICYFMITEIISVVKTMIKKSNEKIKQDETVDFEKERQKLKEEILKELQAQNNKALK